MYHFIRYFMYLLELVEIYSLIVELYYFVNFMIQIWQFTNTDWLEFHFIIKNTWFYGARNNSFFYLGNFETYSISNISPYWNLSCLKTICWNLESFRHFFILYKTNNSNIQYCSSTALPQLLFFLLTPKGP